ncbi:MAG: DUF166 family (seleno)protein DfsP [Dissulfuribacterales bacterium]
MSQPPFKIIVFQQGGNADFKIGGIEAYGEGIEIAAVHDLPASLPDFIENPEEYVSDIEPCDLVLNFVKQPDITVHIVNTANKKAIPIIAPGRHIVGAITPFTCCAMGRLASTGRYGEQFGLPEFEVSIENGIVKELRVKRGAPCGATWFAAKKIIGNTVEEALEAMGREAQFCCIADPSAFDPITGKSQVHFAGDAHWVALNKAILNAKC